MKEKQLPFRVILREVCPRDGFQSVQNPIPMGDKCALIDGMAATGITTMEVTSFVSPKAVPQMADAPDVLDYFNSRWKGRIHSVVLVPNVKGAELALAHNPDALAFVLSVSESHNKANTRRTVEESLREFETVASLVGNVALGLDVATAFQCPFEGAIAPDAVVRVVERALEIGANAITLADTIGTCDPLSLTKTLEIVRREFGDYPFYLHLHDTHGMAIVNSAAAMELGFIRFETAAGGLGGCPFAPGAAGNVATEDMVNFFNKIGVETGIDLEKVLGVADSMKAMGLPVNSHLAASRVPCTKA